MDYLLLYADLAMEIWIKNCAYIYIWSVRSMAYMYKRNEPLKIITTVR